MSLSTRRATCMNVDLRAPLNLPVCLLSLAFRQAAEGRYESEAKQVAQLPEAAPFTKHGSVPCRGALDHAISKLVHYANGNTRRRDAALSRVFAEEVGRAAVVQRLDRPRLEQRARAHGWRSRRGLAVG